MNEGCNFTRNIFYSASIGEASRPGVVVINQRSGWVVYHFQIWKVQLKNRWGPSLHSTLSAKPLAEKEILGIVLKPFLNDVVSLSKIPHMATDVTRASCLNC